MDLDAYNEKVLRPLQRWAKLGVETNNIVNKIGHLPHLAPECYMHQIYKGLSIDKIIDVERALGRQLPKQYKDFLRFANGADFFGPSGFSVLGVILDSFSPAYDKTPWRFPLDIIKSNQGDYISRQFSQEAVMIGRHDGASCDIIALGENGPIIEYDVSGVYEIMMEWPDFDSWLISEIEEACLEHTDEGDLIDISCSPMEH